MKAKRIRKALNRKALIKLQGKYGECYDPTAIHEAGHAVVAHALGIPLDSVELFDGQVREELKIGGKMRVSFLYEVRAARRPATLRARTRDVAVDLAGYLAERRAGMYVSRDEVVQGARGDLEMLRRHLEGILPEKRLGVMIQAGRLAMRVICRHYEAVNAVALTLEERKLILNWDLDKIFDEFKLPRAAARYGRQLEEAIQAVEPPSGDRSGQEMRAVDALQRRCAHE